MQAGPAQISGLPLGTAHVVTPKWELSGNGQELRWCNMIWGKEKDFQKREKIIFVYQGPGSSGTD